MKVRNASSLGTLIALLAVGALWLSACSAQPPGTGTGRRPSGTTSAPTTHAPGATTTGTPGAETSPTLPAIPPASTFVKRVDNPYFPLTPGTVFTYAGTADGEPARDVVTVTSDTTTIAGVSCTVVHDEVFVNNVLTEQTDDWYAQDATGNVWYLGEDTKELDAKGSVTSTEGSWVTGVDGAKPGLLMEADPKVGDSYYQEFYPGQAEDVATVVSLSVRVKVPSGRFLQGLKTQEVTRLEPGVVGAKYYVRGFGQVREVTEKGGAEDFLLVSMKRK